jgi:RNA polymerase sigma-70 factor, ECF subfamily
MTSSELDFEKIHGEYRPRILRYLTRLVGEFEAEDLTQEVFLKIDQALHTFRGDAQLGTWIYRIATNAALDRLRQRPRQSVAAGQEEAELEERDAWSGEPVLTPEQQVFLKQGFDCFYDFLQSLPETYRLVVALDQLGEYPAREIAEMLGLSVEAVKMRLHRGKARLLEELKARCKAEDWL